MAATGRPAPFSPPAILSIIARSFRWRFSRMTVTRIPTRSREFFVVLDLADASGSCGFDHAMTSKSRILIADDNGPNVELLEAYLSGLDCEIAVAVDGRDTLAKVDVVPARPDPARRDDAQAERLRGLREAQGRSPRPAAS